MNTALPERSAAFTAWAGLLYCGIAMLIAGYLQATSFVALTPLLFAVVAVSGLVYFRFRLKRQVDEEARDRELLQREHPESSLFAADETEDRFPAAATRRQFEARVVPAAAPLLGLALVWWVWRLFSKTGWTPSPPESPYVVASIYGSFAFAMFLNSRFLLGLSRRPEARLLRGPGVLMGLACWLSLTGLVGVMATATGWEPGITASIWITLAVTALVGLEMTLNSLLSLYRHRREDQDTSYESRLGALLVDPAVLTRSMTEAIDYQFGFSFSQTWFFRILQQALFPLLAAQAILLYAMSCFVFLDVHETGILERFGKPATDRPVLAPGLHVKKPWPFETVRRIPTGRLQEISVGYTPSGDDDHRNPVITWTVPHYEQEDAFLVAARNATSTSGEASDAVAVSMVAVNLALEYLITNAFDYAYRFSRPDETLRQLAYQSLTRQLAGHELADLFGASRREISESIRKEVQASADKLSLGVTIPFTAVQSVHPPVQVADAFQSVVGAMEEREASILLARAYTNQVLPIARAYAEAAYAEAGAYRHRRAALAEADALHFNARREAFNTAPSVFRAYQYLDTLAQATASSRLYVLDLPGRGAEALWLNLEEKPFSGVLDMAPALLEESHP